MSSSRVKELQYGGIEIPIDSTNSAPSDKEEKDGVNLVTFRHAGLLVSTLFAGVFNTCLKRGLLPLLQAELELETYQADAANMLMLLPWSYVFIWGFLSDAMPLLVLNYTLEYNALSSEVTERAVLGHRMILINAYIGLLMMASFGSVLALVIAETYVVTQTRRERLQERGRALGTLLMTQFIGEFFGQIATDEIIFNITTFGITPLYSFRDTALFFMFYSLVPLLAVLSLFRENSDPPAINDEGANYAVDNSQMFARAERSRRSSSSCLKRSGKALHLNWTRLRTSLGKEAATRVIRFLMIFIFLSEFTLTYPHAKLEEWCNVTDKAKSSGDITMEAFYIIAVSAWKYCAINCNWRWCVSASLILIMMTPQVLYFFMAALAENTRSAEAFMFISSLRGFLRAALIILEVIFSAEIAPVGGEGAFVGIIVSMSSVMRLLATSSSNALGYVFENGNYTESEESSQVAFALGVCYSIRLMGVVALLFLPRQKEELQLLLRYGAQGDKGTTWWVLGSLGCAFLVCTIFNLLAVIPSTSCLRIVGGSGC
ncbi:hypothetical protein BBJ29_005972 [Phytophthora kernoviae]|uniref:Transmembrane protein n=1 Tax=Phytophthora kernoviae TaxID=325452 RepID=A0A3F2RHY3_9STRA|nr:hypothetical protein BBP00_00007532 [Phytophthora kernoviae]RLN69541.1 hypothetical protein BBJ29_005972 [Phytophthora kernoviae]